MRRIQAIAIALGALLAPGLGWAADLTGGVALQSEYDSNVLRTNDKVAPDFIFRVNPKVQFLEDEGQLTYDVRYRFPWEIAVDTQDLQGFRHFLDATAEFQATDRTRLIFSDGFSYTDSINSVSNVDALGTPTIGTFRDPVLRNNLRLDMEHRFSPRLTTTGGFQFQVFDTDLPGRANNRTFGLTLNNQYQYSPRHRFGAGIRTSYQDFDRSNNGTRPPSTTIFASFFGSWSWFINETTTFEIAAGPTYVDNNQDSPPQTVSNGPSVPNIPIDGNRSVISDLTTCPLNGFLGQPALPRTGLCGNFAQIDLAAGEVREQNGTVTDISGEIAQVSADLATIQSATVPTLNFEGPSIDISDQSWTIFAQASLTKRWSPNILSTMTYSRRDSTASGISGSAVLDLVSLINTWRISELWSSSLRVDYTKRQSTSPVQEAYAILDDGTTNGALGPFQSSFFQTWAGNSQIPYTKSFGSRIATNSIDTNRWGFTTRISRRITRNLSSSLRYTFNQQFSAKGTAGSFSDFNDHLVTLSVQYDFDRWRLW